MTPTFKMLSHLMTPFFRNIYRWKWALCSHWMTPIFTNIWPPREMYPIFVWKEGFMWLLNRILHRKIESLTKWPPFFFKLKSSLKDPFFFIVLTKWPPIFLLSSLKDPLFSLLSLSPKDPYFWGRVRTSPSLPYVSGPPRGSSPVSQKPQSPPLPNELAPYTGAYKKLLGQSPPIPEFSHHPLLCKSLVTPPIPLETLPRLRYIDRRGTFLIKVVDSCIFI